MCVNHYALHTQEAKRLEYDAVVDDRTLHEIYLPAFKAAVQEGGAWSVMGAYNLYRGQHLCHNEYMLNGILKQDWGFDGAVISDWGGTHDTEESISNGLDLEFGTWTNGLRGETSNTYDAYYLADPYLARLRSGEASMEVLDDKVRRVLRLIFRTAMNTRKPFGSLCSPEHYDAARRIAGEGIVLLKNDGGVLPLDLSASCRIAVIGENAIKMMTVGGGSSSLKVQHECTPLEGIIAAAGDKAEIVYERGYVGDVSGDYNGVVTGQDLSESRSESQLTADAVALAASSDAVIFVGGLNKSAHQDCEDSDRLGLELPYAQDKVISALAKVNPNLVVVIISGNAVAMPWADEVNGIVEAWFGGSEAGNALADVLFGKVNPSGKLPMSFPYCIGQIPVHYNAYSTGRPDNVGEVRFRSKYIDIPNEPLYPFGYGLSYTKFEISPVKLSGGVVTDEKAVTAGVTVKNTGERAGTEVVQLYLQDIAASVVRPVREQKGFVKVELEAGEEKEITFVIDEPMLRFLRADGTVGSEEGEFNLFIGNSSDTENRAKFRYEA